MEKMSTDVFQALKSEPTFFQTAGVLLLGC